MIQIGPFTADHLKHIESMTYEAKTTYLNQVVWHFLKLRCKHKAYRIEPVEIRSTPPAEFDGTRHIIICENCETRVEPTGLRPLEIPL
jgi:hypothetical protein